MEQREGGSEAGGSAEDVGEKHDEEAVGGGAEGGVWPQRQRVGSQSLGASSTRTFHGALHRVAAEHAVVGC